jgi:hypothetical protein
MVPRSQGSSEGESSAQPTPIHAIVTIEAEASLCRPAKLATCGRKRERSTLLQEPSPNMARVAKLRQERGIIVAKRAERCRTQEATTQARVIKIWRAVPSGHRENFTLISVWKS